MSEDATSTFKSFEEIEAWQNAREMVKQVYAATGMGQFSKDFGLRDQVQRSSVSIMSNIAEGFERSGTREFIQFLSVAKGSAGELRSQLYVAYDLGYIDEGQFNEMRESVSEVSRMISGLMSYLRKSGMRGSKFNHRV